MIMKTKKVLWFLFAFLATGVSLYPLVYVYFAFLEGEFSLRQLKSIDLIRNLFWNIGFYGHVIFGGIALFVGWSQFSKKLRARRLQLHKNLGKIYVVSVLISGCGAVGIGFFATGGWIAATGFVLLGLVWLYTTGAAYFAIKKGNLKKHQYMMIYSYAACFAAVTLRLWLPLMQLFIFEGAFLPAYKIVAWLCWVPNIIFANVLVRRLKSSKP